MGLENSYQVLKTIDNMPRILFWRVDEFSMLAIPFFLGVGLGSALVILSGPIIKYFYSKIIKKYPKGTFRHKLYWNLPKEVFDRSGKLKKLPPSHIREWTL